ncbi:uncharacterized protein LOC123498236 [Portunus trituberculatus]|uniref:uncharacterized protein LOC123498236 n=1 Tax=Portunus trituberculatus TaxID=210409 RepID=UPI001E1CCAAD|nr:uncharacterized protein LOC123498236 [Portunus trituberculatus]
MGGTKSLSCNDICWDLWGWCAENNVWITCPHIPGSDNSMADAASRQFNDRHEWKLNVGIFRELCNIFSVPSIDLFASRLNNQVPRFCSWHPNPEAEHFDAFSITWSQFPLVYIFPPFALIARCLQKMHAEMARGWLIVPLWLSQPWMGTPLLKMLIREPRLIMWRKDILRHPSSEEEHPVMKHTRLMAYLLSDTFHRGVAYDCVNTARRAFSSLGIVVDTWDVKLVLEQLRTLEPLCTLTLKELTLKLVMLMAFMQAARLQTLYLLVLKNICIGETSICVSLGDNIKQCCPKFNVKFVDFTAYATDRRLCVCETLKVYIERTAQFRTGVDQMDGPLFLSIVRPHKPVTRDTIARWVRIMLHRSGVDTRMYSAGSVRQAAALRAKAMAVPIAHILAKAGWSSEATFARHYNKEVLGDIDTFQDGVLG